MEGKRFFSAVLTGLVMLAVTACGGSSNSNDPAGSAPADNSPAVGDTPDVGHEPPTEVPEGDSQVEEPGQDGESPPNAPVEENPVNAPGGDAPGSDEPPGDEPIDESPGGEPPAEEPVDENPGGEPEDNEPAPGLEPTVSATLLTEGRLSPLASFSVRFHQPIDGSRLGADTLLRALSGGDEGEVVLLDAEYSASDNIATFTPRSPLSEGASYVLDLSGIRLLADSTTGAGMAAVDQAPLPPVIHSSPNRPVDFVTYDEETGEVARFWRYTHPVEGAVAQVNEMYNGPGPDGDWFDTADNARSGVFVTERSSGDSYLRYWYTGPGDNGRWDLGEDDQVKQISQYRYSGLPGFESYVTSANPGDDGKWFGKDDDYDLVHLRQFDAPSMTLTRLFGNNQVEDLGPGEDNAWFTPDDNIEYYERYLFDEQLRLVRKERFVEGSMNDGEWFSDDDVLIRFTDYEHDASRRVARSRSYYRPVFSEERFLPSEHLLFKYDGDSRYYTYAVSVDPETDDTLSYVWHERSESGALLKYGVFHGKGPDGSWFTDDDLSGNLSRNVVDENGFVKLTWHYDGLGDDGLRYSGDEGIDSLTVYQYDDQGRLVVRDYYVGPGDDGAWNTPGDDRVFHFTYEQVQGE